MCAVITESALTQIRLLWTASENIFVEKKCSLETSAHEVAWFEKKQHYGTSLADLDNQQQSQESTDTKQVLRKS